MATKGFNGMVGGKTVNKVYGIYDSFHPEINGDKNPLIRSDMDVWDDNEDFFNWCRQHGADNEWFEIKENI